VPSATRQEWGTGKRETERSPASEDGENFVSSCSRARDLAFFTLSRRARAAKTKEKKEKENSMRESASCA